jgi:hypothetical protein
MKGARRGREGGKVVLMTCGVDRGGRGGGEVALTCSLDEAQQTLEERPIVSLCLVTGLTHVTLLADVGHHTPELFRVA